MAPKDIMIDSFPVTKIEVPGQPIPSPTRAHEDTSPTPSYDPMNSEQQLQPRQLIQDLNHHSNANENADDDDEQSADVDAQEDNVEETTEDETKHQTKDDDSEEDDDEEEEEEKNHAIESIEDALEIQKRNFGETHPSIAKTLHSLALEYKFSGQYDKAIMNLREGLDILEERLSVIHTSVSSNKIGITGMNHTGTSSSEHSTLPTSNSSTTHDGGSSSLHPMDDDLSSKCSYDSRQSASISMHSMLSGINMNSMSITHANVSQAAIHAAKRQSLKIHEEKSLFYSCLANIYRDRGCYKEAMDHYLQALNMLVEADYPGDSPRVSMMMRIMKRTERALRSS
eukprot:CAMPEP_0204632596 /NCGR_PEP_ID=MMETSP0717-20131115/25246_1 /ASSEMBLY_ACC=CAM_ASM_000666 /TAXON_ID=230516 /ORGANISM="Chaetoceros curvisetus" /LENGTH=340 /DNA_ID=CAMNT_0051650485 /DNA_START=52 /DNA_END=1074 /DNA_ORIENTATION=+